MKKVLWITSVGVLLLIAVMVAHSWFRVHHLGTAECPCQPGYDPSAQFVPFTLSHTGAGAAISPDPACVPSSAAVTWSDDGSVNLTSTVYFHTPPPGASSPTNFKDPSPLVSGREKVPVPLKTGASDHSVPDGTVCTTYWINVDGYMADPKIIVVVGGEGLLGKLEHLVDLLRVFFLNELPGFVRRL